MITKADCQQYLLSLIKEAAPRGKDALSGVIIQYMQYLVKNFDKLDEEMQGITDKLLDESVEVFSSAIVEAPDSPQIRQARRLLRNIREKRPTAKGLIAGLEAAPQSAETFIPATKLLFEELLQHLIDTLYDVIEGGLHGPASFVKVSLFYTCISELLAAFHLAQRSYASQAYTHIRTVFESLNIIELINRDESYADIWTSNDTKKKMKALSPKAVRKKLGQDKSAYSFFSELGAHPTWAYVGAQSARRKKQETDKTEITFWMGGTKWTQHVLWANSACIFCIVQTLIYVGTSFGQRVHREDYPALIEVMLKDFNDYMEQHVYKWGREHGLDTNEVESIAKKVYEEFKKMRQQQ
jgi:hypothetical protein